MTSGIILEWPSPSILAFWYIFQIVSQICDYARPEYYVTLCGCMWKLKIMEIIACATRVLLFSLTLTDHLLWKYPDYWSSRCVRHKQPSSETIQIAGTYNKRHRGPRVLGSAIDCIYLFFDGSAPQTKAPSLLPGILIFLSITPQWSTILSRPSKLMTNGLLSGQ
jgi:hypothetical protein